MSKSKVAIILLLTGLTGFSGLVYEVCWQKYLANILGSQAASAALTLAVFLAGLGLGYLLFGILAARKNNTIKLCACLEIGIGLWALFFLWLYEQIFMLYQVEANTSFIRDLFYTVLLIGPPTICMGGTLPLLTQGLARFSNSWGVLHARLYAINTAGAFFGCLLTGFLLLPQFGLPGSLIIAAGINIFAGLLIYCLGMQPAEDRPATAEAESTQLSTLEQGGILLWKFSFAAFLLGIISLCLQTILMRLLGISMGASEYAFSMIVSLYILLLAVGSWWHAARARLNTRLWLSALPVLLGLLLIYFSAEFWPYIFHLVRTFFGFSSEDLWYYHLSIFALLMIFLALPVSYIGALLPLLFRNLKNCEAQLGWRVGLLYFSNTLGCVLGAIVGGYLLLEICDLNFVFKLLLALSVILIALLLPWQKLSRTEQGKSCLLLAGTLAIIVCLPVWDHKKLSVGLFHEKVAGEFTYAGPQKLYNDLLKDISILFYKDDPHGTVAVAEFKADPENNVELSRSLMLSGKSDGNTQGDRVTMHLLAHIPALLSETSSGEAAIIGLGTGMTQGTLALYPGIKHIDSLEISDAVVAAAPYFDFANWDVSKNPLIQQIPRDGLRHLVDSNKTYDMILAQPSNPWMSGIERLYSSEFYSAAKQHLSPKGVFVQWISLWGLSNHSISLIFNTFADSFENFKVLRSGESVFLISSPSPFSKIDWTKVEQRFAVPAVKADLANLGITSLDVLLAFEEWFPRSIYEGPLRNTLLYPKLAYSAGVDFFKDARTTLDGLLHKPADWRNNLQIARRGLLAEWFAATSSAPDLARVSEASCGTGTVEMAEPGWRYMRTACRDSLVARMLKEQIDIPENMQTDIQWVKYFQSLSSQSTSPDPMSAIKEIELFTQMDSIFVALDADLLVSRSQICFEDNQQGGAECQLMLVNALIFTGHLDLAELSLQRFEKNFGEVEAVAEANQQIRQYLKESRDLVASQS